jgi:hypothetical protein
MSSQILQLVFDPFAASGQKKQFVDDSKAHHSKRWTDSAGNPTTANADLTVALSIPSPLSLQVSAKTPLPQNWNFGEFNGSCLQITVVFWRNHTSVEKNDAVHDSPFTFNDQPNGVERTVFDQPYTGLQMRTNGGSVNLPLGTPQLSSGGPNYLDRYRFLVSVTLNLLDPNNVLQTFTASQDPQMDVGL